MDLLATIRSRTKKRPLEQNIENEQQLYLNEGTMHYDTAESRAIIENSDQLSDSSAVNASAYNLPDIVELKQYGETMTESDNNYLPNIVMPISIDWNNRKVHIHTIFDFYITGPKSAVRQARHYEANKQKSIMKIFKTFRKSTPKATKNGELSTVRNIKNKKHQRPTMKIKIDAISNGQIQCAS